MKRLVVAALLALGVGAPAAAQQADDAADVTWRAFTTPEGCIFYEGDLLNMVPDAPKATATWKGAPCKPGDAITGTGVITLKRVVNGYNTTRTYSGVIVGGYLNGRITVADTYVSLTNKADKGGTPANSFPYKMGCMVMSGTGELESGSIGKKQIRCRAKTANVAPPNAG
ncbi:MAG TPA: hypothetical protein VG942_07340 [Hyphomonadaceae bacterium]|nr:hypothetical protein [Hyphomonadaceae bacterium]